MITDIFNSRPLQAIGLLAGMTIGVGIFAIPFVFAQSGLAVGLIELAILLGVVILFNLMFAEIALRTKEQYRLPGYVGKYLGSPLRIVELASYLAGFSGALVAYLLVGGDFLGRLGGFDARWGIATFVMLGGALMYSKFTVGARANYILTALMALGIAALSVAALRFFHISNLSRGSLSNAFVPYGVLLFALTGAAIIPDIVFFLTNVNDRESVKRVVVWGTIIPAAIYALFAISMLGALDGEVSRESLSSVSALFGSGIGALSLAVGVLTTFTSFTLFGFVFERMLRSDFGIGRTAAWLITIVLPLILIFVGVSDYIKVIGLIGAVAVAVDGVMIIFMHRAAQQRGEITPPFSVRVAPAIEILLIVMFVAGVAYEFLHAV
ncbi:hypothetical protein KGQ34_03900 [Patescibacteria group bacterium]|nr:hypothetical protein [Patescibacteria group bacterium]